MARCARTSSRWAVACAPSPSTGSTSWPVTRRRRWRPPVVARCSCRGPIGSATGDTSSPGTAHELPITERATGNASHGLVRWGAFWLLERTDDRVVVEHVLHPRPGYPFALEVRLTWQLDPCGLTCTSRLTNVGDGAAPVGYGAHPYLALGATAAADARLTVPADRVVLVDEERLLPTGTREVGGTPFDLRGGGALGERAIDKRVHRTGPGARRALDGDPRGRA